MDTFQDRAATPREAPAAPTAAPEEHPVQRGFEAVLWTSRLIVLVAVLGSLVASLSMFYLATTDTVAMVRHMFEYRAADATGREELHAATVTHVVKIVDGYLLATILLIFAFGLYELFVSRIDPARGSEASSRVLVIRSLDDLKNRLAKVILMILVVTFFDHVLHVSVGAPLELLYVAGGIALVGLALYLGHAAEKREH